MAQRPLRARLPVAILFILLLALASAPSTQAQTPTSSQAQVQVQGGEGHLSTRYFEIYYPQGEEQSAQWYAGFADEVDNTVSDLLGSAPVEGITLRIYATEAQYMQANPLAELHPGILAHALPESKEMGVAVERLRQAPPDLARQSFRHEMTHIVAGAISGQNLTVGFQEGLAQYNEISADRAQEVVNLLQDAQNKNVPLLSWSELQDRSQFALHIDIAYPEAYTVMAFLADRYGMGAYSRFLEGLRDGKSYTDALQGAYSRTLPQLEEQWRDYLPGFLSEGYKQNVLGDYDMAPGTALYNSGRYSEAAALFARSQNLYKDLGKQSRAAEAAANLDKARRAQLAQSQADHAAQALSSHEYVSSEKYAGEAAGTFADLKLDASRQYAGNLLDMSRRGKEAMIAIDRASSGLHILDYGQASAQVRSAGQIFAALGDNARVAEANNTLETMWLVERLAGVAALMFGALVVTVGVILSLFGRRKPRPDAGQAQLREEPASWL